MMQSAASGTTVDSCDALAGIPGVPALDLGDADVPAAGRGGAGSASELSPAGAKRAPASLPCRMTAADAGPSMPGAVARVADTAAGSPEFLDCVIPGSGATRMRNQSFNCARSSSRSQAPRKSRSPERAPWRACPCDWRFRASSFIGADLRHGPRAEPMRRRIPGTASRARCASAPSPAWSCAARLRRGSAAP